MQFQVLGPLEVRVCGSPLPLGGARQRTLLAVLLLEAGRVVSVERLATAIWDESPPPTARAQVQICVSALRRALAVADAGAAIRTEAPGYRLDLGDAELDAAVFERRVAEARAAAAEGRRLDAVEHLRAALALWRGPALDGLASRVVQAGAARLEERRLAALEERIDLELQLGRHRELAGELAALVAEHPRRERLRAQLMLALYRAGRQTEALEVYRDRRRVLARELGLEPVRELRRLERAILNADPSLDPPEPEREAEAVTPSQLRARIPTLTGRAEEVERLEALLGGAEEAGSTVVVAIHGAAGVGKSALATHVAHLVADRFPDGQLYADLHAATPGLPTLHPSEALGRFLRALGVDAPRVPAEAEERAATFRSLLAHRRMLVVLDDVAAAAQARLLLPASAGCAALVTSRRRLVDLECATHLHLDVLDPDEAIELLARLAGEERVAADPEAAARLACLCGFLPLALHVAGARLAARPSWPVALLAERLSDERARLDELRVGSLAVRASLRVTYDGLDTAEARAFRLLSLLGGPDVGTPAAAALLGEPAAAAEAALERLVDAHLLESRAPRRYRFHDLLRLLAHERALLEDPQAEREAALARALRFYLGSVRSADELLRPGRPADGAGADDPTALRFDDQASALAWLEAERPNLVAAIERAAGASDGLALLASELTAGLFSFFDVRGYWDDWERASRLSLEAARRRGDRHAEAHAQRDLGAVAWRRYRLDEARAHLGRSLELRRALEDRHGEAETLVSLGLVFFEQARHDEAAVCYLRSLDLFRRAGDRRGEGQAINNLGDLYREQGAYEDAVRCLRRDLAICRELGDRRGEAITLTNLGELCHDEGRLAEAVERHREAFAICSELGDLRGEGLNLLGLGEAQRLQGRLGEAAECLRGSRGRLGRVGDRHGEATALWRLGLVLEASGDRSAAARFEEALAIFDELEAPVPS